MEPQPYDAFSLKQPICATSLDDAGHGKYWRLYKYFYSVQRRLDFLATLLDYPKSLRLTHVSISPFLSCTCLEHVERFGDSGEEHVLVPAHRHESTMVVCRETRKPSHRNHCTPKEIQGDPAPEIPEKPALLLPILCLLCLIRSVNIVVIQDFRVPVQRKTVSHFLFLDLVLL